MLSKTIRVLALVSIIATVLAYAPAAKAGPKACDNRTNDTFEKLTECVTLSGVREHQQALQDISDDNGGNRSAGTAGYDASVEYVVDRMTAAGYNVSIDEFPFVFIPIPLLEQLTPVEASYESEVFTGSGSGEVTADVTAIDINLAPPRATTSGCDGQFTEAFVGAPIVPHPDGPDDLPASWPGISP